MAGFPQLWENLENLEKWQQFSSPENVLEFIILLKILEK